MRRVTLTIERWALPILTLVVILWSVMPADGATRSFSRRFSANDHGDIVIIGNGLMTCNTAAGTNAAYCEAARNRNGGVVGGTNMDVNNSSSMIRIDSTGTPNSDTNSTTWSSADLSLPSGSQVLWAGLYWSGESTSTTTRNQALFSTPGSFGSIPVTATQVDFQTTGAQRYVSFLDVTPMVQAAGNGTYAVSNVQTRINVSNAFAGWALVVVYRNSSDSLRNLSVFDGFQLVSGTTPVDITVNGFLSPLSGPVVTRLGAIVMEGDFGHGADTYIGDYLRMNGTDLSEGSIRPANDFYNSSITDQGFSNTARFPSYTNLFGFDIASRVTVPPGIITNGATSASFQVGTGGEQVYPAVLTFATDLYVPIVSPNLVKTVTDVNGGQIVPGDTLRFTVSMSNTGLDTATNLVLTDPIPANTTYVPGSLRIVSGANSGAKTDTPGDDQAEYVSSGTPRVVFRLGTGANATSGGNLPYTAATSLTFDVTVNGDTPGGSIISNAVQISYQGQTIGTTFAGASSAATATVLGPPTASKSFASNPIAVNGTSVMTITVSNPAGNPQTLTGVSISDTYPPGLVNAAPANAGVTCTGGSSATLTGGADGGNSIGITNGSILPGGSCTLSVTVTSSSAGNYTNTTGNVTSANGGTGPTATATLSVGKPAVTLKTFSPASIPSGGTSTIQLTLSNPNLNSITGVAFSDTLANMQVAAAPAVTNSCGGTVTATAGSSSISLSGGSMNATSTCSITVDVTSSTTGLHPNQTSGVTSDQTGSAGVPSNVAYLEVIAPPAAIVSFSPPSIRTSANQGVSRLSILVSNQNGSATLTGVSFTSTYPASLVNTGTASPSVSCTAGSSATLTGGANGGTTLGISGGTLLPGGSCTVSVNVTSALAANYTVSTGPISSTNGGTGSAASATLNVTSLTPPTVAKAFLTTPIAAGASSVLRITLTNPNSGTEISGVTFTDTYPYGMVNASTPSVTTTCGGSPTLTALPGGNSLAVSGATIPAGGNCTVTVSVTATQQGNYYNNLPAGSVTTSNAAVNATDASATLAVNAGVIAIKYFSTNPILPGGTSVMNIALNNPNGSPLSGIAFTDAYPAGLFNAATPNVTSSCGGTVTADPNGTSLSLSGGTLAANGSCLITVTTTAPAAGSYTNSTGPVTTTTSGYPAGSGATTTLTVMAPPGVSAAFTPTQISTGEVSLYTVTFTNGNTADITDLAFTAPYPTFLRNAAAPDASTTCGGSPVITAAAGGSSLAVSGASIPAGGSCTVTVTLTTATAGVYTVNTGSITTGNAGTVAAPGASATLTVVLEVSGTVYHDANYNGTLDAGETGTGQTLYVKIATRTGSSCNAPAQSAVLVNPSTGSYSIGAIGTGIYCLILDTSDTLSDITPTYPSGWTGTEIPTGVRQITVSGPSVPNQNFGLFGGGSISGRVFRDTGMGGGSANNGLRDGTETGEPNVVVRLTDSTGSVTHATTTTDGSGNFTLWVPAAAGPALRVTRALPSGFLATGAQVGSTGGSYDRTMDSILFTGSPGTVHAGVELGMVPENRFAAPANRTTLPGTVLFIPHTFTFGSSGSLTFETTGTPSPPVSGWSETLLTDADCSGDFTSGDTPLSGPLVRNGGETVCLLVKVSVPPSAPYGSQYQLAVTSRLSYSNATPPLSRDSALTDVVLVARGTGSGLVLIKSVDRPVAKPGESIVYTILYRNDSTERLGSIQINDATPAYTTFVSAACGAPLPPDITGCSVTTTPAPGGTGPVVWTLGGFLAPSASGTVTYTVTLQP